MELKEAVYGRRSIRKFQEKEVEPHLVKEIIEAAHQAPSSANCQPWRFVAVRSKEKREALREGTVRFAADAPLTVACCADLDSFRNLAPLAKAMYENGMYDGVDDSTKVYDEFVRTEKPLSESALRTYMLFNSAFAIENLCLRAHDLGLGTCIVCMFNQQVVREILDIPENLVITALISVGYPAQEPEPRPRKPLDEIYLKEI